MKKLFLFILILSTSIVFSQSLQTPQEFLGFKVGADYKLADFETIQKYFKHLSENSENLVYEEIGKTVRGKDMFMAIISTAENIKNLDKYNVIIKRLSDPREINDNEAEMLSKDGKIVVLVTCNIHSTEIGSAQMSMELAHDLITGNAPPEAQNELDDVIFIIMPSINPDGTTMVVDWYNKYVGTEYEGSRMPYLYHDYSGHDNNRDWFMFNLPETRHVVKVAYHDWMPQIWLDEHQMGSGGPRLFVVPYKDPLNPNVDPLIWRWQKVIGGITSLRLEQQNKTGVIDQVFFEGWWQGPASDCGLWHNQIALLSEMASCDVASPIYIDPSEVRATRELTPYDIRTNYPHPWRGGWWRLRDIVDYELSLTYSLIEIAGKYKNEILYDYYKMCKSAVEEGKEGKPYAIVIPREQNDPVTTSKMIEILQLGGVEVHYTENEFKIENVTYSGENYIIYLAQPNGRYVRDLFEKQFYPDLRKSRDETPIRPYDVAGWTLPYLMGVDFTTVDIPFNINSVLLTDANYPDGNVEVGESKYFISQAGPNVNSTLINRLQKEDIPVYWLTEKLEYNGNEFLQGSVVFENDSDIHNLIEKLADELHLDFQLLNDVDQTKLKELKKIKVGLYKSYTASMDEGWTRLLLENYEFDFVSMYNEDFQNGNLKDDFDVIIIPDMDKELIKTGKYTGEYARYNRPKPPEYKGGIDSKGVANLKKFVEEDGGYLLVIGDACEFAIEELNLKVRNTLKEVKRDDFFCPGSLVKINVNNTNPIGYGIPENTMGYLTKSIAFQTSIPFGEYGRSIVARFPTKDLLESGYLFGEDYLFKKGAVVEIKHKNGHVVLYGIKVQNRHWTYGTFKLLFNAIHKSGLDK
ncbi:M14 metallopeptidase family protein [Bacteroidota bacterium]